VLAVSMARLYILVSHLAHCCLGNIWCDGCRELDGGRQSRLQPRTVTPPIAIDQQSWCHLHLMVYARDKHIACRQEAAQT